MTHSGSCLCGAAKYRFDAPVTDAAACHCGMCRKWSGGVGMAVEVPPDGLRILSGDTIRTYRSSDWGERAFCGDCGSSLWFRLVAPGPQHGTHFVNIGALDDVSGITLSHEMFIDRKPEGYAFAGDHTRMTEAEFLAMVEGMMAGDGGAPA